MDRAALAARFFLVKPLPVSWALAASAVSAMLLACGGCAERLFQPAPQARTAPPKESLASKAGTDATANVALDRLARAALAWSKRPAPNAAKRPVLAVYVDTEAIAHRMPQWRLADSLEHGTSASFVWNESFASRPVAGMTGSGARLTGDAASVAGRSDVAESIPNYLAPDTATAATLPGLEEVARRRQDNAFTEFLHDAARHQRDARFDRAEIMRSTLEDAVEAAKRAPLDDLAPAQLDDAVQLEMSNLRLKLLTAPAAQKEALQARLTALEASWQQHLHEQEAERLTELTRLRRERPMQVRRAGEEAIRATLQQGRATDEALRSQLGNEHMTLVSGGFSYPALAIGLPGANLSSKFTAPPRLAGGTSTGVTIWSGNSAGVKSFKTSLPVPPSYGAGKGLVQTSGGVNGAANRGESLRQAARTEASAYARSIARRNGWKLVEARSSEGVYRDETAAVLRSLPTL